MPLASSVEQIADQVRRESSGLAQNYDLKHDQGDLDEIRHLRSVIRKQNAEISSLNAKIKTLESRAPRR